MIDDCTIFCETLLDNDVSVWVRYREIAGFEGVLAGCLVALKQIMPDNEVVVLKVIRFRVKVNCFLIPCNLLVSTSSLRCIPPEQQLRRPAYGTL